MNFKLIIVLLAITSLVACSNNRKKRTATNDDVNMEQSITSFDADADFIVDADDDKFLLGDDLGGADDKEVSMISESSFLEDSPSNIVATTMVSEQSYDIGSGEYVVEKGDTLMLISFKLYGDYTKWREISRMNNLSGGDLAPGTVVKYNPPVEKFVWNPRGNPYLVKRGDTLGTISQDKYNTTKKWKNIWENNKPMIKDPNLIFAGFTLYYVPERDIASESLYMD
jgi:nucleoid-associated protein YgaU